MKFHHFVGSLVNFIISSFGRRTFALNFLMLLAAVLSAVDERILFKNSENRVLSFANFLASTVNNKLLNLFDVLVNIDYFSF